MLKKLNIHFFHKNLPKDNIPLKLLDLQKANKTIDRTFSIKFFGVMLDKNITWKDHIHTFTNKSYTYYMIYDHRKKK